MNEEQKSRLTALAAHMNKVEGRLKAAENIRQEVVIAGINELRYAGRRFVDAWALLEAGQTGPEIDKEIDDHFVIAGQYLTNADHDVTDAICFYVHGEIYRLQRKYGASELLKVDPDYIGFITKMNEANGIVTASRETRSQRGDAYDRLEREYLSDLLKRHDRLRVAEPLILAEEKKKAFWLKFSIWFGVVGGFIGIIGSAITIIGWDGLVHLPLVSKFVPSQSATQGETSDRKMLVMTMPPLRDLPIR